MRTEQAGQTERGVRLPPAPGPALDPYLDAAARCFTRFGVARTSVQDIARELGVNRTTVYRQVGNVQSAALLLVAREMDRVLSGLPARIAGLTGPEAVVELLAAVVEESLNHPVMRKMLTDERDMIGSLLADDVPRLLGEITDRLAPLVALLAGRGAIADRDPLIIAEWLTRIALSVVVAEPRGPLRRFLAELLVPALRP